MSEVMRTLGGSVLNSGAIIMKIEKCVAFALHNGSNYHSINEIEYDISLNKFNITSNTFIFNKDSNPIMLDLFNKTLA